MICLYSLLYVVQKEKYNKRRLVAQVERVFLALPPMLADMSPDYIRRFIKGLSDEARMIKQRLLQAAAGQPIAADADVAQHAAIAAPVNPLGALGIQQAQLAGQGHIPPGVVAVPAAEALPPAAPPAAALGIAMDQHGAPNQQAVDAAMAAAGNNPQMARRVFEPIRIAVMVSSTTATLYPQCFNAQTLATIIRNTFNLVAWGFPHAEIK